MCDRQTYVLFFIILYVFMYYFILFLLVQLFNTLPASAQKDSPCYRLKYSTQIMFVFSHKSKETTTYQCL
jgi:hypothetical protein